MKRISALIIFIFLFTNLIFANQLYAASNVDGGPPGYKTPTATPTPKPGSSTDTNSSDNAAGSSASNTGTICIEGKPCNPANSGTSGNAIVDAGQALFQGYKQCNGGVADDFATVRTCLIKFLQSKNFPSANIAAATNNMSSYAYGCIQCIGFVRQTIDLAYGGDDPRLVSANGNTPVVWDSMNNNGNIFKNIGSGATVDPEPGDIATISGDVGEEIPFAYGHILIVKSVNGSHFTGLESNWDVINGNTYPPDSCHISDSVQHPKFKYFFFRKQSEGSSTSTNTGKASATAQ